MESLPVFVGLDYHKDSVQVCVMDSRGKVLGNSSCDNSARAVFNCVSDYGTAGGVAIESCTGSADLADELIAQYGWSVDMAHPGYVSRMKLNPDKTDFADARILADLERLGYLPKVWLAPHEVRELRLLVRMRHQIVAQRRDAKLRIHSILRQQRVRPPEGMRPFTLRWLYWLSHNRDLSEEGQWVIKHHLRRLDQYQVELREVESRLAGKTAEDPVVQGLRAERGIGRVTAWVLRAEVGRFDRFRTSKQLARFCGLCPRNASSGARQADAGLVQAANGQLRSTLIEAAQSLIQWDEYWRSFARRMKEAGKPHCLVVAAVANRWVRRLFHRMNEVKAVA